MSIKRTGGRKPTMGNWRASIWPRANMQYVNVVISMGICIWMHARYTLLYSGDTRALATCALGLTPARHPRIAHFRSFRCPPPIPETIARAPRRCSISAPRGFANAFFIYAGRTRFRVVCTQFPNLSRMNGEYRN